MRPLTARPEQGKAPAPDPWPAGARRRVLRLVDEFLSGVPVAAEQRALLEIAQAGLRRQAERAAFVHCIHLPLLVHAAIRGDDRSARPLAVATSLIFLGLDILDDLADGDNADQWGNCQPAEIHLLGTGLLGALPQLALCRLAAPDRTIVEMIRAVAEALVRLGAGQQADLRGVGAADLDAARVEGTVIAKSGESLALYAELAARLAGADDATIAGYQLFGRSLGAGLQLVTDCDDLLGPASRDLARGARTYPLVAHLDGLAGSDRAEFLTLLDRACHDPAAGTDARRRLIEAGTFRRVADVVEVYRLMALAALGQVGPRDPAATRLGAALRTLRVTLPASP